MLRPPKPSSGMDAHHPDDGGSKHLWTTVSFYHNIRRNSPENSHRRRSFVRHLKRCFRQTKPQIAFTCSTCKIPKSPSGNIYTKFCYLKIRKLHHITENLAHSSYFKFYQDLFVFSRPWKHLESLLISSHGLNTTHRAVYEDTRTAQSVQLS
jgi:hypothetical protein